VSELTDYQRGLKEGARDALLEEHTARLNKINGSVERHAKSNEVLAREFKTGMALLAEEIRDMKEEARAREIAVRVAAETLATETARREKQVEADRIERAAALEVPVRWWRIRSDQVAVFSALVAGFVYLLNHFLG
jgi:hypothetical protein